MLISHRILLFIYLGSIKKPMHMFMLFDFVHLC